MLAFIVNQDGKVYPKDLGRDTAVLAKGMATYRRTPGWRMASGSQAR